MGWIANILIVIGLWQVGSKVRNAFLWTGVGEALWFTHAVHRGLYDLAALCLVFAGLAIRNWWKWGQDETA